MGEERERKVLVYEKIARDIREKIITRVWAPGSRLPTTRELCQQYQVTIDTIQRALKLLVQEGWISRQPKRGSIVLQGAKIPRIVLLVGVNLATVPGGQFFQLLIHALYELGRQDKYIVEERYLPNDNLFLTRLDNLIQEIHSREIACIYGIYGNELFDIVREKIPLPILTMPSGGWIDYYAFGYRATNYLVLWGYRKLKMIIPKGNLFKGNPPYEGVLSACTDYQQRQIQCDWFEAPATEAGGYQAMRTILEGSISPHTGIVSFNDNMTRGALLAIAEKGLTLGKDLGFLSHANKGIEIFSPIPLTCLEFDPYELAQQCWFQCKTFLCRKEFYPKPIYPTLKKGKSCGETD